jgi:hypothetical protein
VSNQWVQAQGVFSFSVSLPIYRLGVHISVFTWAGEASERPGAACRHSFRLTVVMVAFSATLCPQRRGLVVNAIVDAIARNS